MLTPTADREGPAVTPYLGLALGVVAVSFGAIFARMAGEAPPLVIAAYRVGLAALVLAPMALLRSRRELAGLSPEDWLKALLAGLFLTLHFATWITSLSYTSVANSVVLVNTNPLWVGLLTPFIAKERIPRLAKLSIGVSVLGGAVIGYGDLALGADALWGDFLALCGSVCAAVYLLLGRAIRQKLSLLSYIMVCYGSAAMLLWALVLAMGLPIIGFRPETTAAFWAMALVPQLVGHTCYNWSLKWFSASTIAVSLLGEPIGATILAFFLFGEGLTLHKIAGGGLILAAIYLAGLGEAKKE